MEPVTQTAATSSVCIMGSQIPYVQGETEISEYTAGMQEVLKELSTLFKAEIVGSLFASISWKTNVIWPAGIEGAEMWDLQIPPPVTLVQKLKTWVGLGGNPKLVLTPAAATAFS